MSISLLIINYKLTLPVSNEPFSVRRHVSTFTNSVIFQKDKQLLTVASNACLLSVGGNQRTTEIQGEPAPGPGIKPHDPAVMQGNSADYCTTTTTKNPILIDFPLYTTQQIETKSSHLETKVKTKQQCKVLIDFHTCLPPTFILNVPLGAFYNKTKRCDHSPFFFFLCFHKQSRAT